MPRQSLEIADIFHDHGPAWRAANAGHVSLDQLKVMSAIERCRTAVLGGHVARCEDCAHEHIAYNSCRNRPRSILGPKCQAGAARDWLAAREAELPPVGYFHVVFTLPAQLADIAYQSEPRKAATGPGPVANPRDLRPAPYAQRQDPPTHPRRGWGFLRCLPPTCPRGFPRVVTLPERNGYSSIRGTARLSRLHIRPWRAQSGSAAIGRRISSRIGSRPCSTGGI